MTYLAENINLYDLIAISGNPIFEESESKWKIFKFNFGGWPEPEMGTLAYIKSSFIKFRLEANLIRYEFGNESEIIPTSDYLTIEDPIIILSLSTTNSAHSMSELNGFLNRVKYISEGIKIAVNSIIIHKLPFLYEILSRIFPKERLIILEEHRVYRTRHTFISREHHFNEVLNWTSVGFEQYNNAIKFKNLYSLLEFRENPNIIYEFCRSIYRENRHKYDLLDRVSLIKTGDDKLASTPGRAMTLEKDAKQLLSEYGFKICAIDQFSCIEEYICTIYHARIFLTSYGGAACTNRFFANPHCKIVLLGNESYRWEYEYPSDIGEYWHLRHSHLFPVQEQIFIRDQPNIIGAAEVMTFLAAAEIEKVR